MFPFFLVSQLEGCQSSNSGLVEEAASKGISLGLSAAIADPGWPHLLLCLDAAAETVWSLLGYMVEKETIQD